MRLALRGSPWPGGCWRGQKATLKQKVLRPLPHGSGGQIWVRLGSNNSSWEFLATPKVAASAVECQSVTVSVDPDTAALHQMPTAAD